MCYSNRSIYTTVPIDIRLILSDSFSTLFAFHLAKIFYRGHIMSQPYCHEKNKNLFYTYFDICLC